MLLARKILRYNLNCHNLNSKQNIKSDSTFFSKLTAEMKLPTMTEQESINYDGDELKYAQIVF